MHIKPIKSLVFGVTGVDRQSVFALLETPTPIFWGWPLDIRAHFAGLINSLLGIIIRG
jgi:hypothetical protein